MVVQDFISQLAMSLQGIASGVLAVVPQILGALVVFVLGLIFASALEKVVREVIRIAKINEILEKAGLATLLEKAGLRLDVGKFLGGFVRVFFVVVFLVAAFDILGLNKVNEFLGSIVLGYLPQVFVAVLVLLGSVVIADFSSKLVMHGTKAIGVRAASFLAVVVRASIWVFAIIVALSHLGIGAQYLYTIFTGFVVMVSLAGGLAFGLGGKEAAADLIRSMREELRKDWKEAHKGTTGAQSSHSGSGSSSMRI